MLKDLPGIKTIKENSEMKNNNNFIYLSQLTITALMKVSLNQFYSA